ncbi:MAG TPA: cyclic nucleotide-binding domain-containing protein [Nocardioides sp.]|nr:cyclic nucleotide-binding domain-containing protein [Nocardioides sp.]
MATFFEHFTPQEIARISATGRRVKLPEGWSPIWKDTPADKAYIILEGTASVRKDGKEIAQLGPGDIVGEAAIVGNKLRSATIVALTPLDTIHLTDQTLRELDAEWPTFHQALVEVAQSRVDAVTE